MEVIMEPFVTAVHSTISVYISDIRQWQNIASGMTVGVLHACGGSKRNESLESLDNASAATLVLPAICVRQKLKNDNELTQSVSTT